MSQESDGTLHGPEDENLDQLIQGLPDIELLGALLQEPNTFTNQRPHGEYRSEDEGHSSSIIETPGDEQVSQEAAEPTRETTSHSTVQNDLPTASATVIPLPLPINRKQRKVSGLPILFPGIETPKLEIDTFSDVSRKEIGFQLTSQHVIVKVENLKCTTIIGEGGFGIISKMVIAGDPSRSIAVKRLKILNENNVRTKLRNELKILQAIAQNQRCPYIIGYYGALLNPYCAELCFLMELMPTNLQQAYKKLHESKTFVVRNVDLLLQRVAYNILVALTFMHGHNLCHYDIKPTNILLDCQGHLKLADFGESDYLNNGKEPRTSRPGTLYYCPPECIELNVMCSSERFDLWALAVTLLETSTGEHPYPLKMDEIELKYYLKSWVPNFPLEKMSQESADFLLHLFDERPETEHTVYNDILQSDYLADLTSDLSAEEIDLFQSIT